MTLFLTPMYDTSETWNEERIFIKWYPCYYCRPITNSVAYLEFWLARLTGHILSGQVNNRVSEIKINALEAYDNTLCFGHNTPRAS